MSRGYFGIGIYHPKRECNVGGLWRTAHSLGAAFVFTIGRRYRRDSSDTTHATDHVPLFEYESLDQFTESQPPRDCWLVGVELDLTAVPLLEFVHPERAVYLLGAEDTGLPQQVRALCYKIVQVPGKFCLNVSTAGSIVMYDRLAKESA